MTFMAGVVKVKAKVVKQYYYDEVGRQGGDDFFVLRKSGTNAAA